MFEEFYQKYLIIGSNVPEAQRQKLNFLIFAIKNHSNNEIEINPENYPDLDIDEIQGLFNLPVEAQKSMFCSVFKSLELEDESKIMGELNVKGETLGIWRSKKLELNLTHKKLIVPRKEGDIELQLSKYGIMWVGQKKTKSSHYCFILIAHNQAIYDHYKQLIMGSDDEEYAKKWFNLLSGICDTKPIQPRRMSVEFTQQTVSISPLNKSDQLDLSKSDNLNNNWLEFKSSNNKDMQRISEQPESPDNLKRTKQEFLTNLKQEEKPNFQVFIPQIEQAHKVPAYLSDMTVDKFKQGEFYRVGNNVYKSVSKKGLYQVQIILEHDIEIVRHFLYEGLGFNKFISTEWTMFDYQDYKVVDQIRIKSIFGFEKTQQLYIMRYKATDCVIEKQLNSVNPIYSIAKLFRKSIQKCSFGGIQRGNQNYSTDSMPQQTIIQIIYQLDDNVFFDSQNISFMEQYNYLADHIDYVINFRDLHFEQKQLQTVVSLSNHSEDLFVQQFNQSIELQNTVPNNLMELLEFVQNNKHWDVCLNKEFQIEPMKVEPKFQKSTSEGHFLLKNYWKVDENQGGLLYVDQVGLREQKKVFSYLLSQIGSNLATGKSITNISLPVYVFEKQSNLQRYANSLTYLQYLDEAVSKDYLFQIKNFLPYGYGTIILYLNMWKPFNPILGETYSGFINGCPIYAEQVSHHPPISNLLIYGKGYRVNHRLSTIASISANSVNGINQGYTKVYFYETKNELIFLPCSGLYTGTLYGDKLFQMVGKFHVINLKHKLVAEIKLNPYPGSIWKKRREHLDDYYEGCIYEVNDDFVKRFQKDGYLKFKELKQNEIIREISKINGVWHKNMYIDNKEIWNINTEPYVLEDEEHPLPSDSNFRVDLIAWKTGNFDLAMKMKTNMEEAQRADAKLRKKR
ncbi:unnamed protein product (macronuclear) [Paramecium tetraurelia]|uniref:PH domain-containing protein n=1 Tax=Paramecium tetraurelia TaxID=5888 RepID=A0CZ74_PARTE|nr:uncharacterized protein GSPATT00011664001 [Paramecium tetraurelia]CAK76091.1 unnamed protein product [Paramecium tetraurelia]|eukprot:XP_001443488.1 hypothetical protein (macronuclear) [Paramecium tetraurelia strain d4-2]